MGRRLVIEISIRQEPGPSGTYFAVVQDSSTSATGQTPGEALDSLLNKSPNLLREELRIQVSPLES